MKKRIFSYLLFLLLFASCSKTYIQLFDTRTINTKLIGENYVFENDTVKITYTFWDYQGVMSFSVYNKLSMPLYIDWKNCAFIVNDEKLNYWIDESQTDQVAYYGAYYYYGDIFSSDIDFSEGVQTSTSKTVKTERITFIPPKSYSTKTQFRLLPVEYFEMGSDVKMTLEPRTYKPEKSTKVYSETYEFDNSPLRFRNFIAVSFSENSQEYSFVDNEFYMNSVKLMDLRQFQGKKLGMDKSGEILYEKPLKKPTSFYITFTN